MVGLCDIARSSDLVVDSFLAALTDLGIPSFKLGAVSVEVRFISRILWIVFVWKVFGDEVLDQSLVALAGAAEGGLDGSGHDRRRGP